MSDTTSNVDMQQLWEQTLKAKLSEKIHQRMAKMLTSDEVVSDINAVLKECGVPETEDLNFKFDFDLTKIESNSKTEGIIGETPSIWTDGCVYYTVCPDGRGYACFMC